MDERRFDDIIVGAGQAGPSLAVRLAQAGRRTALVEGRRLGGTCVNDGCIPTKTLIASARAAHVARNAQRWGVHAGPVRVDMARVKARKDAVVQESRDGLDRWLRAQPGLELLEGWARFTSPHTVEVNGIHLRAERFFLNVGARAVVPDLPGLRQVALTNVEMMLLDEVPGHLLVVGGSFVGLEFAQAFRRFGSQVTVLERGPRLVPREDEDVARVVTEVLGREGLSIRTGVEVASAGREESGGVRLTLSSGEVLRGTHVLVAVGRAPATAGLGLEAAGVAVDAHGNIPVNGRLETNQPHIHALGDVNGRGAFTHTSYNDHEVVAANLLEGAKRTVDGRVFVANVYLDPPVGRVGLNETQARATGRPLLRAVRPMTAVGRARERGETDGFLKLLADAETRRLLGATLVGVEADEAVHAIAALMATGATVDTLRQAVFAHPTVSELLPTVAGELRPLG